MKNVHFTTADDVMAWMRGHNDKNITEEPAIAFGRDLYREGMLPVTADLDGMSAISTYWVSIVMRFPDIQTEEGLSFRGSNQYLLLPAPRWPQESNEEAIALFGTRMQVALSTVQVRNKVPLIFVPQMVCEMMPTALFINHWNILANHGVQGINPGDGEKYVMRKVSESQMDEWLDDEGNFIHPMLLPLLLEAASRQEMMDDDGSE